MIKKQISFFIKDTYTGNPSDPLSLNLYTYCSNNPIMYYDPTGYKPVGRQGMPNDLWIKTQGMIIDRKMNFDKDAENIELGSYRLEADSMLYLQDELLIHGQQPLKVIGEQIRENRALYFETGDKRYLNVLKLNYEELNTLVQKYGEYGFEIYNYEFVKDDNYYKILYNTYYQEDGFTRWLYLDRNKHTLFSEAESHINSAFQLHVMGKVQNMNSSYQTNNNLSSLDIEKSRLDRMEFNAITGNVDKPTNIVPRKSYFNELEGWSINRSVKPEPVGEPQVFDKPIAGDNIGVNLRGNTKNVAPRKTLIHYTDEAGMNGILESKQLNPSLKANNPKDAYYGNGQYLSDIQPGTKTPAQLSRTFINNPFQGKRFSNYVEIDVTDLNPVMGRDGVYVIPNETPLDLTGRIVSSGKVGR